MFSSLENFAWISWKLLTGLVSWLFILRITDRVVSSIKIETSSFHEFLSVSVNSGSLLILIINEANHCIKAERTPTDLKSFSKML